MLYLGQAVEIIKGDEPKQRGVFLGMKYGHGNLKKAAVAILDNNKTVVETECSLHDLQFVRQTDKSSPTGKSVWAGDCCTKIMSDSMVLKIPDAAKKTLEAKLA